jgi:glycerol-3-phosphate acyltransferase PlsY
MLFKGVESFVLIISYFIGSIPSGFLLGKFLGGIDLRKKGSSNIGATNSWRVMGRAIGITTLVLDLFKGGIVVVIATHFTENSSVLAGCISVIGHIFPVWLKFKGGKGVATFFGVMWALNPIIAPSTAALWYVMFKISHTSSYLAIFSLQGIDVTILLIIQVIIICRHHSNIARLLRGHKDSFRP